MLGVYVGGKSGGHLNPAVTFANCLYRGHPWRKLPVYALAQLLGAMTGAAIVYANYKSAFDAFEGGAGIRTVTGPTATAGVFCTYPAAFMTRTGMFFSEFIASSILMFCIFALADPNNIGAGNLMPLCLFFLIFGIGACFGWETGYAINLARDFGPRLVSFMIGYGHEVWSAGGYYFWVCRIPLFFLLFSPGPPFSTVMMHDSLLLTMLLQIPMVAPFCGCAFGGFLYDVFIFTGNSPINTPMLGLQRLMRPRKSVWSNTHPAAIENKV